MGRRGRRHGQSFRGREGGMGARVGREGGGGGGGKKEVVMHLDD